MVSISRPAVTRWLGGAVALLAVAAAATLWARTRPGFDPYGWLTWGQTTWHGGLDTDAAPSWKPLPYVFTLVYGLFGTAAQLRLWMVTATWVSLAGVVFAGRVGWRLAGRVSPWAAGVGAAVAAISLLALHDEMSPAYPYLHYVLSAQSDPMIVALVLLAVDGALAGRRRLAYAALVLAGLGRPEVWPFVAVGAAWLWRGGDRGARALVLAGLAALALLWFGVPALSSRSWFVAGDNAFHSGRAPSGDRMTATLHRFVVLTPWPLHVAALLGLAVAVRRRDRVTLALAGAIVVWVAVEIAFALHGWPDLGRYLFEPAAVECVIAGALVGRLLAAAVRPPGPGDAARTATAGRAAAALLPVALVAGLVVFWVDDARSEHRDLVAQRARTARIDALGDAVARAGGAARIRGCGEAISDGLTTQTVLADLLRENVERIGFKFPQPGHPDNPVVVFSPAPGGHGWSVRALRQTRPECRALDGG